MNARDDDQPDLFVHLSGAFEGEPAMQSRPGDDLDRGRRLQRRRRRGSVSASVAAVALLAVGGWALTGGIGNQSIGRTQLQPASSPGAGLETQQPSGTITSECATSDSTTGSDSGEGNWDGDAEQPNGSEDKGSVDSGSSDNDSGVSGSAGSGSRSGSATNVEPQSAEGRAEGNEASEPSTEGEKSDVRVETDDSGETADCETVEGDGDPSPEVDRLMKVLTDHADPDGSHTGDQMSMGGSAGAAGPDGSAGQTTSIFAGTDWTVGDRAGSVSLSVEDPTGGVSVGQPCGDEPMAEGPEVTCEALTLADGTTVLVGHGQRNGAERITVRYERPDGTVVVATADQATQQWWNDGSGAAPLAAPPATVDQLVELVRDPRAHL
jgi:hypothetical protein